MMTDPIADMLTRIRNATRIHDHNVSMPASRMRVGIAEVLKSEGYINEYKVERFYRDVRLLRLYEGTTQIQQIIIGRQLMNRGPGALLDPA